MHFTYMSHMIVVEWGFFQFRTFTSGIVASATITVEQLFQIRKYNNVKMSPSTNNFILRKDKFKPCGVNRTALRLLARQINNCLVKVFFSALFLW